MIPIDVEVIQESGAWKDLELKQTHIHGLIEKTIQKSGIEFPSQKGVVVSIVLSDNESVQNLNKTYRGKDAPTNVLAFPQHWHSNFTKSQEVINLGDIILSLTTIIYESKRDQKPLLHHIDHLIVHGMLHLLGFDHGADDEAEKMENLEIAILQECNIPNPY